jgi:hypothetical protein
MKLSERGSCYRQMPHGAGVSARGNVTIGSRKPTCPFAAFLAEHEQFVVPLADLDAGREILVAYNPGALR